MARSSVDGIGAHWQFFAQVKPDLLTYCRQWAWLWAPQTGGDEKKGTKVRGNKSRATLLTETTPPTPLPLPIPDSPELVALLARVGPSMQSGNGPVPITAQELAAWTKGTGVDLSGWEFETLLDMSHAYTMELIAAADPTRAAPWTTAPDEERRAAIAKSTKTLFRS